MYGGGLRRRKGRYGGGGGDISCIGMRAPSGMQRTWSAVWVKCAITKILRKRKTLKTTSLVTYIIYIE